MVQVPPEISRQREEEIHDTELARLYDSQDVLYSLAGEVGSRAGDGDDQQSRHEGLPCLHHS